MRLGIHPKPLYMEQIQWQKYFNHQPQIMCITLLNELLKVGILHQHITHEKDYASQATVN